MAFVSSRQIKMFWDQHVDVPKILFREPAPLDKQGNIHFRNDIELYVRKAEYRPNHLPNEDVSTRPAGDQNLFLFNRRRRLRCEIHKRHSMYISTRPAPHNQAENTSNHHANINHPLPPISSNPKRLRNPTV